MDIPRRSLLAQRAAEMRRNMTPAEKALWFGFLRDYELSFRPQKVIGNYIVDFYCRKVRLSIEIDGDSHFNERSREYDKIRTLEMEMREIKEVRFTNLDIAENLEGVCEIIHQIVTERRHDIRTLNLDDVKRKT